MPINKGQIDPLSKSALDQLLQVFPGGINSISELGPRRAALRNARGFTSGQEFADLSVESHFVTQRNVENPELEIRLYKKLGTQDKDNPGLIFIHGGGMIMGDLDTADSVCRLIASKTGVLVASIDYRKAPEFPYPAAINDCQDAALWVFDNAEKLGIDRENIGLYGGSAGGGLALGLALLLRDKNLNFFKYLMPIYPMIDDRNETPSSYEITDLGVWDRANNIEAWGWYLGSKSPDYYAAPTRANNLENLPPCYSDVGEFDLFRDENIEFFERLKKAGVPTVFKFFPGAFHGSEIYAPKSELSKKIWESRFNAIETFIAKK